MPFVPDSPSQSVGHFVPDENRMDPTSGMSTMERLAAGAGSTFARWGNRLRQATATGIGDSSMNPETGVGDEPAQKAGIAGVNAAVAEQAKTDAPLMATTAGKIGSMLPQAAASLVAPTSIPAQVGIGALTGALEPTQEGGSSALANMAEGGAGGLVGGLLGKGVTAAVTAGKSLLAGPAAAAVKYLKDSGFVLSAAQQTGRAIPAPAAYGEAQSRQLTQKALEFMGIQGKDTADTATMDAGRRVLQNTYDELAARTTVALDKPLVRSLGTLRATAADTLTPENARIVTKQIDNIVSMFGRLPSGAVQMGSKISGTAFRNLQEAIGNIAGDGGKAPVLADLGDALRSAMIRSSSPADAALLAKTNTQYAAMKVLQKGIDVNDRVSPDKLWTAIDSAANDNAAVFGRTGSPELVKLGQAAKLVLGSGAKAIDAGGPGGTGALAHLANYAGNRAIYHAAAGGIVGGYEGYRHGSVNAGAAIGIAAALFGPTVASRMMATPGANAAFTKWATSQGIHTAQDAIAYAARKGTGAAGVVAGDNVGQEQTP